MNNSEREAKLDALQARLAKCQAAIAGPTSAADRRRIEAELRKITKELKAIPPLPPEHLERHIKDAILRGLQAREETGANTAPQTNPTPAIVPAQ